MCIPAAAGQGAGNMLCDALEKLAAARSARLTSRRATPRGFFEQRGYAAQRATRSRSATWLANTTMASRSPQRRRQRRRVMKRRDVPFPRHWLYYIILKYAVIAVAVALTLTCARL